MLQREMQNASKDAFSPSGTSENPRLSASRTHSLKQTRLRCQPILCAAEQNLLNWRWCEVALRASQTRFSFPRWWQVLCSPDLLDAVISGVCTRRGGKRRNSSVHRNATSECPFQVSTFSSTCTRVTVNALCSYAATSAAYFAAALDLKLKRQDSERVTTAFYIPNTV